MFLETLTVDIELDMVTDHPTVSLCVTPPCYFTGKQMQPRLNEVNFVHNFIF